MRECRHSQEIKCQEREDLPNTPELLRTGSRHGGLTRCCPQPRPPAPAWAGHTGVLVSLEVNTPIQLPCDSLHGRRWKSGCCYPFSFCAFCSSGVSLPKTERSKCSSRKVHAADSFPAGLSLKALLRGIRTQSPASCFSSRSFFSAL